MPVELVGASRELARGELLGVLAASFRALGAACVRGTEHARGAVLLEATHPEQGRETERGHHRSPIARTRDWRCCQDAAVGAGSSSPCCRNASIAFAWVNAASTSGLLPET
ncbi:hypothetical protein GALL_513610 [mine drainage metagenome]|uniref:Uncharacterized protein n=1 Tax=mine drainage metagenome TaxID=410659 RepID=A0A1J5PP48_9ZZZZ